MTRQIYVRGNVGALDMRIYDADTDKQLMDVAKITIVTTASVVQAELVRLTSPNVTVDVVAGPPAARAGQTFHLVTLDTYKCVSHHDTVHEAKVQDLTMNDDGTLDFRGGQVTFVRDAVSDADMAQATNPRNELWDSADRALTGAIRVAIVKPKLDALLLPATGGVVSKPVLGPNPFSRTPVTGAPNPANRSLPPKKATSCPECFDTGLTNGFMHPCSKGCTP